MNGRNNTLLILLALLLLGGGGYAVYTMTRGLRNNNPGNIRDDGTAWEGLATPRNDGTFLVFTDPVYGIRAMGRILSNYVNADGVTPSVTGIVSRWAPPSENDTASYIADVARKLGVDPNAPFDLSSALGPLVAALISHENALNPYSDAQIAHGLALS